MTEPHVANSSTTSDRAREPGDDRASCSAPPSPGGNGIHGLIEPRCHGTPCSAAGSLCAWAMLFLVMIFGAAIDIVTKSVAFERIADTPVVLDRLDVLAAGPSGVGRLLPPHEPIIAVPNILEFRLVLNPGAVFGIGPGRRWFFIAFTLLAIAMAIWAFVKWTSPRDVAAHIALGLILAGGLGNLYDRLLFGCVRDFLHPLPGVLLPFGLSWPSGSREVWPWVSNVADALLLVGIGLLVAHLWRTDRAAPAQHDHANETAPHS